MPLVIVVKETNQRITICNISQNAADTGKYNFEDVISKTIRKLQLFQSNEVYYGRVKVISARLDEN